MSLFLSKDEAHSWNDTGIFWRGPCGYSDIQQLNDTHLAVLYENGISEFAQQISFGLLDISKVQL